ncbi:MAG: hypothetical protein VZR11_04955 [Succinimonas sp.]|nr:hypothetical protein [Succinimonas sp.]
MNLKKLSLALLAVCGMALASAYAAPQEKEDTDVFTVNEVIASLQKGSQTFLSNVKAHPMVKQTQDPYYQYYWIAGVLSDWDKDMLPKNMPSKPEKVHSLNDTEKEQLGVILTLASEIRALRGEASRLAISVNSSKLTEYDRIMGYTYEYLNGSFGDEFIETIQGADAAVDKCMDYVKQTSYSPKGATWNKLLQYSGIQQYAFGSSGKAYNIISAGNAMMRYYRQVDKSFMSSFLPNIATRNDKLRAKIKEERSRVASIKDIQDLEVLAVYLDALDIYAAKVDADVKRSRALLKDIYDNGKNSGKIINGKLNLKQISLNGVPATYVVPFSRSIIMCKDSWNRLIENGQVPLSEKQNSVKI